MPDSLFIQGINAANDSFSAAAAEDFKVVAQTGSVLGVPGTYSAVNITDLTMETALAPGGETTLHTVMLDVFKTVVATAQIVEGTKLEVRGKRVRVGPIADEADNVVTLICESAGASLK